MTFTTAADDYHDAEKGAPDGGFRQTDQAGHLTLTPHAEQVPRVLQ
jgi:hypothetical protein